MQSNSKLLRNTVKMDALKLPKASTKYESAKRMFDLAFALALFVVSLPLFLIIAVLTSFDGSFKPIFTHSRCGKGGCRFRMYKFRTMRTDAQEILHKDPELLAQFSVNFKLDNDPRVTRLGKILRRTSLDELPQLLNVVKGDMSLVGPRPIVAEEIEKYGKHAYELFSVKPGLTGLWQISGRSNVTYPERVALDRKYVANRCVFLDLKILLLTFVKIFTRDAGAQ